MPTRTAAGTPREEIAEVSRAFSLDLVFLFGSQKDRGLSLLQGNPVDAQDPLADLDIGVVFAPGAFPPQPYKVFGTLYADLQEIFRPLKVDLVFLEETESTFQFEAIRGACVFCRDQEILENYIERVLRRASDWHYTRKKIDQEFLARTESHGE